MQQPKCIIVAKYSREVIHCFRIWWSIIQSYVQDLIGETKINRLTMFFSIIFRPVWHTSINSNQIFVVVSKFHYQHNEHQHCYNLSHADHSRYQMLKKMKRCRTRFFWGTRSTNFRHEAEHDTKLWNYKWIEFFWKIT